MSANHGWQVGSWQHVHNSPDKKKLGATSSHVAAREIRCEKTVLSNLGLLGTAESCQSCNLCFVFYPVKQKRVLGRWHRHAWLCTTLSEKHCFCTSVSCLCVEFNQPFPNWEQHISHRRVSITKGKFDCPRFEPVHSRHFQTHAFILK